MKSTMSMIILLALGGGCNTQKHALNRAITSAVSFDASPRTIKQTYLQLSSCSSERALTLLKDSLGTNNLSFFLLTATSELTKDFQCHITPESILPILRLGNGKSLVMTRDITSLTVQKIQEGYEGSFMFNVNAKNEFYGKCLFLMKEDGNGFFITKLAIAHNTLSGLETSLSVFDLSKSAD